MASSRSLWPILLLLAAPVGAEEIRFADDRDEPIGEPLTVCLVLDLATNCHEVGPGDALIATGRFDSISAESAHYGPSRSSRPALRSSGEVAILKVPRKAALRLHCRPPREPLALSLYEAGDPTFRRPAYHFPRIDADRTHVPAGDFVLSLSAPGRAPDLHRVVAPPGGEVTIAYTARSGWSVLLRTVGGAESAPVAGATIEIRPAAGYGDPAAARTVQTDRHGLAVVSGLAFPLARANVRSPAHLDATIAGLAASPGTFAFQEARLARGGNLRASISLLGEPVVGAVCELREPAPDLPDPMPLETRSNRRSESDATGVCRFDRISPGPWLLAVTPEKTADSNHVQGLWIDDERETELTLELDPIAVEGIVLRGDEPAPGYQIAVLSSVRGELEQVTEVETDEDGRYRAEVWQSGEYFLTLASPSGAPAGIERLWVGAGGAFHDFRLARARLEGRVADEEGEPVGGASVYMRRREGRLESGTADDEGRFHRDLDENGGDVEVWAYAPGFERGEPATVTVPADGPVAPVILVLRRNDDLRGTLAAPGGGPLPGALIAGYQPAPGPWPVESGTTVTDAEGRFVVPRAARGATLLFVAGAGCPLHSAEVPAELPRDRELDLTCPPAPANLLLEIADSEGAPLAGKRLTLRKGGHLVPARVLGGHLAALGLPAATDGSGRFALVGIEPGTWEVFLDDSSSPETIAAGLPYGHVATVDLAPLATREISVTLGAAP